MKLNEQEFRRSFWGKMCSMQKGQEFLRPCYSTAVGTGDELLVNIQLHFFPTLILSTGFIQYPNILICYISHHNFN